MGTRVRDTSRGGSTSSGWFTTVLKSAVYMWRFGPLSPATSTLRGNITPGLHHGEPATVLLAAFILMFTLSSAINRFDRRFARNMMNE
ncbi:MAG: hypothetical protein ACOC0P_01720 [Planctomycetota bacterium]